MTITPDVHFFRNPQEDTFMMFMIQILVILVVVRSLGRLFYSIGQPPVVGQILAGVILGPTVLGNIPGFSSFLFPSDSAVSVLQMLAKVGLVFRQFFLGLTLDPNLMKDNLKVALPIACGVVMVPFLVGVGLFFWLFNIYMPENLILSHLFFVATSVCFTSFPVLVRVLNTCNLVKTPLGFLTLSTAAIADAIVWCLVTFTLAIVNGGGFSYGLLSLVFAGVYLLFVGYFVIPALNKWLDVLIKRKDEMNSQFISAIVLVLCVSAFVMQGVGVDAFFGGFVFGLLIPRQGQFVKILCEKLEFFLYEFLLPVYFCMTGLSVNLCKLDSGFDWGVTAIVTLVAFISSIGTVTLICHIFVKHWRVNFVLGILLNTRGLNSMIVINLGYSEGLINKKVSAVIIIMSLISTIITTPWIRRVFIARTLNNASGTNKSEVVNEDDGSETTGHKKALSSYTLGLIKSRPKPSKISDQYRDRDLVVSKFEKQSAHDDGLSSMEPNEDPIPFTVRQVSFQVEPFQLEIEPVVNELFHNNSNDPATISQLMAHIRTPTSHSFHSISSEDQVSESEPVPMIRQVSFKVEPNSLEVDPQINVEIPSSMTTMSQLLEDIKSAGTITLPSVN